MKRVLLALLSLPMSALADGGLPNQPYIYIEGKAEIEKPADMVTLRFNLVARAADPIRGDSGSVNGSDPFFHRPRIIHNAVRPSDRRVWRDARVQNTPVPPPA
jgi:hypothetical protein